MNDIGVTDRFLDVFSRYVDSGFGLLGEEVAFLSATLVVIDMTLAGLMWASGSGGGGDQVASRLVRKTLYVGAFAFIISNFSDLATIIFRSFAELGLTAAGSEVSMRDFMRPGRLAVVGIDAGRPFLFQIAGLSGFPDALFNLDTIVVLFVAWLVIIFSFFILAVQLFVVLIEFKLTTLAGFVLVPFALWGRTAFLAERVLGNVVSSGVKVMVLAVIVGIGSGIFREFALPLHTEITIDHALTLMLASLSLFALGLFGPGIATGLVSGAPQLGAGAVAGTAVAAVGAGVAGAVAAATTLRATTTVLGGAIKAGRSAFSDFGGRGSGTGRSHAPGGDRTSAFRPQANDTPQPTSNTGGATETGAERNDSKSGGTASGPSTPKWAQRLQRQNRIAQGASAVAHVVRSADRPGSGANPSLPKES